MQHNFLLREILIKYLNCMFKVIHPNHWFIWCLVVIFCAFVFIEWQIFLLNLHQEQFAQIQESKAEDLTSSWKSYKSEKNGFEFKYPEDLSFEEGYSGDTISNFIKEGDNFIDFRVWDIVEGRNQMDSFKYKEANLFAPEEVNFQNGKFLVRDGYGTGNYYFVNAYFDGGDYVYDFMMSRPDHSPELLKTFVKILASVKSIE